MASFRFIYVIFIIAALFINVGRAAGLVPSQDPLRSRIRQGIELTLNNRFFEARILYQELIEQYPLHPMGYFYSGATLQAEMMDAENFEESAEFYRLMTRAIQLGDSLSRVQPPDGWVLFYQGSAYLYRSFLKMKTGDWYPAYRDASSGVDCLENALRADSLLYDAYLGVGSYKYWKSAKAKFLLWLPFIADEREQGIDMIHQAIENGEFIEYIGRDQLVWILLDYGNDQQALRMALENHRNYPDSRFFRWTLASAAFHAGEMELSSEQYRQLLSESRNSAQNNHYNELDCLVQLAQISRFRADWEKAYQWSDEALRLKLDEDIRERARNKLKKALDIRNEAAEHGYPARSSF